VTDARGVTVVHVITGLQTGGAETVLTRLLTHAPQGAAVSSVISLISGGPLETQLREAGVVVESLGMTRAVPSLRGIARFRRVIRQWRPDVIQGWMYHGNLAAWYGARVCDPRPATVWNVRQTLSTLRRERPLTRTVIRLNRRLAGSVDTIVYNSKAARAQHERFGFLTDRAVIIPNGFDCRVFRPDPTAGQRLRAELGIAPDQALVGVVNRFHPMKGHGVFLQAARLLLDRGVRARFVCAGRDVTWENQELRQLARQAHLEAHLHLLGERPDTPQLFAALDVACCPSLWGEGFPNVVGEALACGTPCVATDVGDTADVLGEAGRVVPAHNPAVLADALYAILDLPSAARIALGQAGRERIIARYSLEVMVQRYHALYVQLASRRPRGID
jgi:glycosyltransferase involved in cell wall biosynthesis